MASDKIQTATDATFDTLIGSATPVLVDFWAEWCMPCRRIAPVVDQIADEYAGRLTVAKMNVDDHSGVPTRFGIRSIPTLMLFKSGEMVDTIVGGVDKSTIMEMLNRHV